MAIMGTFMYEEDFLSAAKNLKLSGFDNISLLSPLPLEEAQEVLGLGKSPVRRFALAGAIIGAISGFAMAAGTALVFILPTGGRAIITIPPYLIITYEMTILFGVLFTLLGFHFVSGLPAWRDKPYLPSGIPPEGLERSLVDAFQEDSLVLEQDAPDLRVDQHRHAHREIHYRSHVTAAKISAGRLWLLCPELYRDFDNDRLVCNLHDLIPDLHQMGARYIDL